MSENEGTDRGTPTPGDEAGEGTGGEVGRRVVVVGPDGRPVGTLPVPAEGGESDEAGEGDSVTELINQPAKVMRIGSSIKQLLDEVRSAPLDEAGRSRLREVHERSIRELEEGLAPELIEELERISLPFSEDDVPTEAELRIAQAQLVGWLEGLFHGIQTALFAQQMAARAQLDEMRRQSALGPGGGSGPFQVPNQENHSGPYL